MTVYHFNLNTPTKEGRRRIAVIGHNEDDARLRAISKGYDLVNSTDENRFIKAFTDALNKKK